MTARARRHQRFLAGLTFAAVAAASLAIGGAGPVAADAVSDKQAEAKAISDKLSELESKQMDLNAQYEQANYALKQSQDKVDDAQRQADATQAELEDRRADLQNFSVQAYVTGNDSSAANALLTSDPSSGVEKKAYVQTLSGNRQDLIDSLNAAKQKADDDQAALEAAQGEAESHAKQIDKARSDAAAAADEQRALNDKAQGELATLVAQEQAKRAEEQAAAQKAAAAQAAPPAAAAAVAPGPRPPTDTAPAKSTPPPASSAPPPPAGVGGAGAIAAGMTKMGAPYVWGAAGPSTFDCSGFTSWAYAQVGISLPHYSGAQYAMTTRISRDQLQPGDLVFYGPGGSDHVAIYMGGNQLLHTFRAPEGVTITALDGWWKPPSGYGRIN